MAMKEPFMVKSQMGAANDLVTEITAESGQSILIKGLSSPVFGNNEFVEALLGRLSVGYFRVGKNVNDNHLEFSNDALWFKNLHDYLVEHGIFKGYPVAEGETFTLKNVTAGTRHLGRVIYEIHDAGDITKDMPGGSESTEFSFINYGTNTSQIEVSTYGDIDKSLNPKEYPSFPFGVVVPANREIDVHGILLKVWGGRTDDTPAEMRYLRLSKDREVLFDEDRTGIYATQGLTYYTYHTRKARHPFIPFPTPMTFLPGEELKIELSCGAANHIDAEEVVLALVETVRTIA